MFELIIVVLMIIGFMSLSSRIGKLEHLAKKGHLAEVETKGKSAVQTSTTPVPDGSIFSTMAEQKPTQASSVATARRVIVGEEEGGKWLGKIGVVALLLGVSFFLKYAFDNNIIGVIGRVMLGLVSGVALLALGQYLRAKYQRYSDIIMGGGIGILYLTIYASFAFYSLISQPTAFIFLFCVTVLAVVISIVDDAFELAAVGIFGGFLTPFLISTGNNAMVSLLSYILILDIGVLAISFREKWLRLNYLAFVGTILIFFGWFVSFYTESQLFPTLVFLSAYFLVFLVATVAHHLLRNEITTGSDLTLVTINAIAYFGMAYLILDPSYHAFTGFFAVVLALLYFLLAFLSLSTGSEDKVLNLYLSGIAILFLTLAIPIQLTGTWITLAWLIEAVVIAGFSTAVPKARFHAYGPIIYTVGLIRLFSTEIFSGYSSVSITPFFNRSFFLFGVAIIAAYVLGFFYEKAREEDVIAFKPKTLAAVFLVLANLITIYALTTEVSRIYDQKIQTSYIVQAENQKQQANYQGTVYPNYQDMNEAVTSFRNQRNTAVSILWAVYAIILTALGFAARSKILRSFGLIFFFVTALKIFIDIWSLGQLYRIISSIAFGVIALLGSFAYAKYKDRIKQIITE